MTETHSTENFFLDKVRNVIGENLSNEHFGVSELAKELGMSRSNLHRKINSMAKISVSQFIRQERLIKAKEILRNSSFTVSEVAYKVGFNNVSYFIKCFRQYYGYSPGEIGKRNSDEHNSKEHVKSIQPFKNILVSALLLFVLTCVFVFVVQPFPFQHKRLEKTIALIPPYIEAKDSSYSYLINGTIKGVINNLCKIQDIELVCPWSSVLQFKGLGIPADEISAKLNVNFVVESSAIIIDDMVQLDVNLIDGKSNKLQWSQPFQFSLNASDLISVYQEISYEITNEIKAEITRAEREKINERPTQNNTAYQYYQRGVELLHKEACASCFTKKEMLDAKFNLEKAIEYDDKFALAYAELAFYYHLLNRFEGTKKYTDLIWDYAEKAMFYAPENDMSYIAKAVYFENKETDSTAIKYLERALEINPNSHYALFRLAIIYGWGGEYNNREKVLYYTLKAFKLRIQFASDLEHHVSLLNVADRLRYFGFFKEAEAYYDKLIEVNPRDMGALSGKAHLYLDMEKNAQIPIDLSLLAYQKDSTSTRPISYLARCYYQNRDYENALKYFYKSIEKNSFTKNDAGRVAMALIKLEKQEEADEFINLFITHVQNLKGWALNDYFHLGMLSSAYFLLGEPDKGLEQMKNYLDLEYYPYWIIRLYKKDPIYDEYRDLAEFTKTLKEMENKFWANHKSCRKKLESEGLLDLNL